MDTTHIMLMIVVLSIFAISGLVCGLIIHGAAHNSLHDKRTVKNSFVLIIVALVFVILFDMVYFGWHMLHNHKVKAPRKSTKMY